MTPFVIAWGVRTSPHLRVPSALGSLCVASRTPSGRRLRHRPPRPQTRRHTNERISEGVATEMLFHGEPQAWGQRFSPEARRARSVPSAHFEPKRPGRWGASRWPGRWGLWGAGVCGAPFCVASSALTPCRGRLGPLAALFHSAPLAPRPRPPQLPPWGELRLWRPLPARSRRLGD